MEQLHKETASKLKMFANMIFTENLKFNLTGLKTEKDIYNILVYKSILDLSEINVPRRTSGADLGTGSGTPGIVLALLHPEIKFTLLDSNGKKIQFIKKVCNKLDLKNVNAVECRIEEFSRENRSTFDFVVSRAFGPLYYSFEFGLSLLRTGGKVYIYSNCIYSMLSDEMKNHIADLGGYETDKPCKHGILIQKKNVTPDKYPRRFPVIKREAKRIPEISS